MALSRSVAAATLQVRGPLYFPLRPIIGIAGIQLS